MKRSKTRNGAVRNFVKCEAGLSLIEITLAIVIFATAIPSIGYVFGIAFQQESENSLQNQASFLARALMDEISERAFYESVASPGNCPVSAELSGFDRTNFKDIGDYAIFSKDCGGVSKWGSLSPPRDEMGSEITGFSKFSQYVEVVNIRATTAGPTARPDFSAQADGTTDYKLVTVTIGWNNGARNIKLYKVFAKHT